LGEETVTDTEIKVENVTFSYDGKRDVLKNVSMTFPKTGMTAIVGESGCGKSTVVNMLFGAFRPKGGAVTVGGKELESLSRESYYSHLAVVSYNTYIFNETVRANFMLANKAVTDEEIYGALEKVNLADFIRENGGLDKVITEDAANISGGQKQRLALAVNLVAHKDIYVFDEATSNIDIESEAICCTPPNIRIKPSRNINTSAKNPGITTNQRPKSKLPVPSIGKRRETPCSGLAAK
jgi:ATP-binding cassette subfamily C protein